MQLITNKIPLLENKNKMGNTLVDIILNLIRNIYYFLKYNPLNLMFYSPIIIWIKSIIVYSFFMGSGALGAIIYFKWPEVVNFFFHWSWSSVNPVDINPADINPIGDQPIEQAPAGQPIEQPSPALPPVPVSIDNPAILPIGGEHIEGQPVGPVQPTAPIVPLLLTVFSVTELTDIIDHYAIKPYDLSNHWVSILRTWVIINNDLLINTITKQALAQEINNNLITYMDLVRESFWQKSGVKKINREQFIHIYYGLRNTPEWNALANSTTRRLDTMDMAGYFFRHIYFFPSAWFNIGGRSYHCERFLDIYFSFVKNYYYASETPEAKSFNRATKAIDMEDGRGHSYSLAQREYDDRYLALLKKLHSPVNDFIARLPENP